MTVWFSANLVLTVTYFLYFINLFISEKIPLLDLFLDIKMNSISTEIMIWNSSLLRSALLNTQEYSSL